VLVHRKASQASTKQPKLAPPSCALQPEKQAGEKLRPPCPFARAVDRQDPAHWRFVCYMEVANQLVSAFPNCILPPDLPLAVDRQDPAHWRSVLAAMSLTQEQEAELILLLQWHLKQASRRVLCVG